MRFTDGAVVITGAASGIGWATAEALSERGVATVLVDRDPEALACRAAALRGTVGVFELDVTDESGWARLADTVDGRGPVAGLVNAAGVFQRGSVGELTGPGWDRVVEVNLKGTFLGCRAMVPLLERSRGAIVNLASMSGRTRSIYAAPSYTASKAGVIGLTMALAAQHAARGVRVNCVAPGLIDTPMLSVYTPSQRERAVAGVPMGRMGSAAEVAEPILFLLSDLSSYVTGQTLNVNGGAFMQ